MIRRVTSILVCCVVLAAGGARAFDGTDCSGFSYQSPSRPTCSFSLKRTPLTIFAEAEGVGAAVHLQVKIQGYPEMPPFLECSDVAGPGETYASCAASLPDDNPNHGASLQPSPLVPPLTVTCSLAAKGRWGYSCSAGKT